MANTYSWKITQLAAKIHSDGLDNVIYSVQYNYIAKDNSDPVIERNIMGSESVTYKEGDPFIPYEDLTKEDVVGWLESMLDVPSMQEGLDKQIELQKNPVDEYLTPDWD
tara:strand:+ start:480 stop:806 length:327 start_codon:yes stop_codon:yes gene_type:complete